MNLKNIKNVLVEKLGKITLFIRSHKLSVSAASAAVVVCIVLAAVLPPFISERRNNTSVTESVSDISSVTSVEETVSEVVSQESQVIEESTPESKPPVSSVASASSAPKPKKEPAVSSAPAVKPAVSTDYKYNTNTDIDDNIFMDSLIYTGYNINKHRSDGKMWTYILSANKRGMGYLSKITYGGGSSGYETANGKPNIKYFEKHGLVCASYVTYVYFNYLPNVAGIDTSMLARPTRPTSANDWYQAAKKWVSDGYTKRIGFTASKTSAGFINFKAKENIPIGSIIVFCDSKKRSDFGSHVAVYAGYKNGYNWLFHVGNKNGPEFCAIERMNFGHDPQWPIAVIATPTSIRMSACLEVTVSDNSGNAVKGSLLKLKNNKTGELITLGESNGGKLIKEGLRYGEYTLSFTVPDGYTSEITEKTLKLTTASNSYNKASVVLNVKPPEPAESLPESSEESSTEEANSEASSEEASEIQ